MILRAVVAALMSLSLFASGVKNEPSPLMGAQPDKRQVNPSKPPRPLGP
jgi:hypothetical protein